MEEILASIRLIISDDAKKGLWIGEDVRDRTPRAEEGCRPRRRRP